jgi:hypothetical protein
VRCTADRLGDERDAADARAAAGRVVVPLRRAPIPLVRVKMLGRFVGAAIVKR